MSEKRDVFFASVKLSILTNRIAEILANKQTFDSDKILGAIKTFTSNLTERDYLVYFELLNKEMKQENVEWDIQLLYHVLLLEWLLMHQVISGYKIQEEEVNNRIEIKFVPEITSNLLITENTAIS